MYTLTTHGMRELGAELALLEYRGGPDLDYFEELVKINPNLPQMLEEDPNLQKSINVDAWFDILAFQPAQATFGVHSGGMTGRGLGLGFVELIPVADSDYIYAAIGEELGLLGGLLIVSLIACSSSGGDSGGGGSSSSSSSTSCSSMMLGRTICSG